MRGEMFSVEKEVGATSDVKSGGIVTSKAEHRDEAMPMVRLGSSVISSGMRSGRGADVPWLALSMTVSCV